MAENEKNPIEMPNDDPRSAPDETPAPDELLGDLETYQQKIESDWESARNSYQAKINSIMDEFIRDKVTSPDADLSVILPSGSGRKDKKSRMDSILDKAEDALKSAENRARQITGRSAEKSSVINVDWSAPWEPKRRKSPVVISVLLAALLAAGGLMWIFQSGQTVPLPYSRTGAIVVNGDKIHIADWFRKSLYIHNRSIRFPLHRVESLPNEFLTGLTVARGSIYSLDGFKAKILQHDPSPEHLVLAAYSAPGTQPVGLRYHGNDLWTMDLDTKKLYRFHGVDPSEIKDEYAFTTDLVTGFDIMDGRVWILDKKARTLDLYRLEDPLLKLNSYDLDPVLRGAAPTAFSLSGSDLWLVTENPSTLIKTRLRTVKAKASTHPS